MTLTVDNDIEDARIIKETVPRDGGSPVASEETVIPAEGKPEKSEKS